MDRRQREVLILQAAKDVFAGRGYHRTGVSDIIKRAGIARGTFYLYFTSKRALLERLLDDFMGEIQARVRTITLGEDDPPPLFQLRANLSGVIAYLLEDRAMTRILLHHAVGLDPKFDEKLAVFETRLMKTIEESLLYGQEIGLVRSCDTGIVALCVLGMIKEVVRTASASPRTEVGSDRLVDEILVAGLRGVLYETPKRERKRKPARPKAVLRLVKVSS